MYDADVQEVLKKIPNKITGHLATRALPSFENEHPLEVTWDSNAGA